MPAAETDTLGVSITDRAARAVRRAIQAGRLPEQLHAATAAQIASIIARRTS